jgi:hypothetical protein
MSILCSLIGHNYGEETIEERQEEQNGKTAVIEISKKECVRCQDVKENRMNTSITHQSSGVQNESSVKDTNSRNETKDRTRDVSSDTVGTTESDDDVFRSAGYTSTEKDIIDGEADGGVILESNNETKNSGSENLNQSTSNLDDTTSRQSPRTADEDEGVHRLNQDDENEEKKTTEFRIICESCTFSKVQTDSSRRSGDLCPSCGSWLEVKELKDTDTSEL